MVPPGTAMTAPTDDASRKGLWPVYVFVAFIVAGFVLAALGVQTCL